VDAPSRNAPPFASPSPRAWILCAMNFGILGRSPPQRRQQLEHLQAERDHDDAGRDDENGVGFRRQRECRSQGSDGAAEKRVGNDPSRIEIDERAGTFVRAVSCRLAALYLAATATSRPPVTAMQVGHGGDHADHERQAVADRIGYRQAIGEEIELPQDEISAGDDQDGRADLGIVAARIPIAGLFCRDCSVQAETL